MPHQPQAALFTCFGFVIWGDLGPTTIYRNRKGKVVFFNKTWPHKPPSPEQTVQRNKMRAAAAAWQTRTTQQKAQWELASRRASLCASGYATFVHWQLTGDDRFVQTLARQTRTTLD